MEAPPTLKLTSYARFPVSLLLGVILLSGLALRLYGINWDQGYFFHPDERFLLLFKLPELAQADRLQWADLFDPSRSPWNPHWFAYGTFPLYVLKFLYSLARSLDASFVLDQVRFLGRGLSAVADTGTVLLVFLIARRFYGSLTGLLAAAFAAFAVLHVQLSHFATFDVLLTFFVMLTLYGAARLVGSGDALGSVLMGVGVGLGLATKVSIAPILAPVAVAYILFALFPDDRLAPAPYLAAARLRRALRGVLLTCAIAGALFVLGQPYAILDWATYIRDTREQSEMAMRIRDYPYTRQYVDTPAYLYDIQQLSAWGLGWPLGIIAWLGLAVTIIRGWLRREKSDLLLLAWVLPYFLFVGAFPVKFLRYMLPITPLLLVMGARFLVLWWERAAAGRPLQEQVRDGISSVRGLLGVLPALVTAMVLVSTLWYALAYTNVYRQDHPAVRLSAWINEHAPKGALLLKEHWEEGVPKLEGYRQEELTLYENDDTSKLERLAQQLSAADYIVLYSNRLYGAIPRLPDRYPMSSRYYQLLFSGQLGFELAYSASASPSFLGVTWNTDTFSRPGLPVPGGFPDPSGLVLRLGHADESFLVYDHPNAMIFQKARQMSTQDLRSLLGEGLPNVGAPTLGASSIGLVLSPQDAAVQQSGGTWRDLFQVTSLSNRVPLLVWLFAVEVIGLLAFPLTFRLFSAFPDRGYLLAKGLGLLLVAYCAWLAASLRVLPFASASVGAMVGLLAVGGAAVVWRGRSDFRTWLVRHWKLLLSLEALWLVAFFTFYLIRLLNPDLWHPYRGGEKPMDFAYLNAIIKSTYMPPYDPWYSGGYLNYYYFGQFIVASVIKLTGIMPSVGYNLAVPTLYALLVGMAFSVGSALAVSITRDNAETTDAAAPGRLTALRKRLFPVADGRMATAASFPWPAGTLALLFVAVVGNLDGAVQIFDRLQNVSKLQVDSTIPGIAGTVKVAAGLFAAVVQHAHVASFDYWRSRGMGGMDPSFIDPGLRVPSISITEFPFFTYLFADLHAHLIALPFTLLALAFGVQLVFGGWREKELFTRGLFLVLFGLTLGALRWINSWDFPTYLLIGFLAVGLASLGFPLRMTAGALVRTALAAGLLLLFSVAFFRPFQENYKLFYNGGLAPSPERTPLLLYLRIHGLFLFPIACFLGYEVSKRFGSLGVPRLWAFYLSHRARFDRAVLLSRRLVHPLKGQVRMRLIAPGLALLLLPLIAMLAGMTSAFLFLVICVIAVLALAELGGPSERGRVYLFVLGLIAVAAALSLLVELVKFDIPGEVERMNNVFKLYLQVWVLYSIGAGYAIWWLVQKTRPRRETSATFSLRAPRPPAQRLWMGCMVALLAAALVYPVLATPKRIADRFVVTPQTPDGMAFMIGAVYDDQKGPVDLRWDYEGIRWLQEHVDGSPVIVEAVTPIYRWGARVSIYTGLPTVIGWDWHQSQQRWDYRPSIETRTRDVNQIYSESDTIQAQRLLTKYGVRYIYVGLLERLYYPAAGLAKFDAMVSRGLLTKVYENPQTAIYALK